MLGQVDVASDLTVARLHGELDRTSVDALRDLLAGVCATDSTRVVVDLRDVGFVDVLSLSVILGTADELRETGRHLSVEGASNSVRRLCELLNAEDILAPRVAMPRASCPPAC
jgi:anti-anti-sigma factor